MDREQNQHYFTVTQPLPQVYRLWDPRGVYLTLLVGSRCALLADTGTGAGDVLAAVEALTDKPVIVVNTHGHIDHTGGNYQFDTVWLASEDHSLVKDWTSSPQREQVLTLNDAPIPADFDRAGFLAYDGANLRPLRPGRVFDLGDLTVEAVPLPTHTHGSMGFYCRELGLLLTGDSLSTITYLVFPESCTVSTYITILEGIGDLLISSMLSAHEAALLGREHLDAFLRCAKALRPEEAIPFRNPMFPDIRGRMYLHKDPCCPQGYAGLVFVKDKLTDAQTERK